MLNPKEFLTKYTKYHLFDWIEKAFIEIVNDLENTKVIIVDGATRTGSSFLESLLIAYLFEIKPEIKPIIIGNSLKIKHMYKAYSSMLKNIDFKENTNECKNISLVSYSNLKFNLQINNKTEQEVIQQIENDVNKVILNNKGIIFIINDPSLRKISKYINQLKNKQNVKYYHNTRWSVSTKLRAPVYYKTGETFKVYIGDKNIEPFILQNNESIEKDLTGKVITIPIDFKKIFEYNLYTAITNIAGYSCI